MCHNTRAQKKLIYVVPGLDFFNEGYRGRVMHALGICEGFAENGWRVTVIGGQSLKKFALDIPISVNCVELSEPTGKLRYVKWWSLLIRTVLNAVKKENHDLLIVRYAALAYLFLGCLVVFLPTRTKKVIEVNSFAYHMAGRLPRFISVIVSYIESLIINRFDALYLVSEAMLVDRRIKCFSIPKIVIPNGATTKKICFESNCSKTNSTDIRLVYLGTLMHYWDFEFLVNAVNNLHKKLKVKIAFHGDGSQKSFLVESIENKELVEFGGSFDRNKITKLFNPKTDILLLPPKTQNDMILTGGLSTKMFDYLSIGLPILAPSDGEIPTVLKDESNSLLYTTQNLEHFCNQVERLQENKSLRRRIAQQAYEDFLCNYSWKVRMNQLVNGLKGESIL